MVVQFFCHIQTIRNSQDHSKIEVREGRESKKLERVRQKVDTESW